LDVINYNDLIYNVDVGFDDNLSPDFYPSVSRDQVQFGESLEGLTAQYFDFGDVIQGDPTVPLTITEGISRESLLITDGLGTSNSLCGLGLFSTLGNGAISMVFSGPVIEFGFRVLRASPSIGQVGITFINAAGDVVEDDAFDDNVDLLPDFVAWKGSTSTNTMSSITIINISGGGICIDDIRFRLVLMPTLQPSVLPSMKPSSLLSNQPSFIPSLEPSLKPSLSPTLKPSRFPSTASISRPSSKPSIQQCIDTNFYATKWGVSIGYGYFFEVTTLADVRISGMAVHATSSSFGVNVYAKLGTYVGSETRPSDWKRVRTASITGLGPTRLVDLGDFDEEVFLEAGAGMAFRVVSTRKTLLGRPASKRRAKETEDGVLSLFVGDMTFEAATFVAGAEGAYAWNGLLRYCQLSDALPVPSLSPTITAPPVEFTYITLSSGFYGISSVYGNYFDVRATRDANIVGFCVHTFSRQDEIKVYTNAGTYANYGSNPTSWTLAQTQLNVSPEGYGELTHLEMLPEGIPMSAGSRRAFLVLSRTRTLLSQRLSPNGLAVASNEGLMIYSGPAAYAGPTARGVFVFNGCVKYQV